MVRVTSPLSWKNKWGDRSETAKGHGGICVRGRFGFEYIDSHARLQQPLMRRDGKLIEAPWLEAIHSVVDRLVDIKAKHGPDAIAGLITARCTNEELYLFQKLMRVAFGTNQLDSSARYGHINFVRAAQHAVGVGRTMNDWEDLTKAKAILLVGSNLTETNPLTAVRVKDAIRIYKAQVIVVDSAQTNIAKLSSHPMMVKPGSEGMFVQGLVKSAIEQDLIDTEATENIRRPSRPSKKPWQRSPSRRSPRQTGMAAEHPMKRHRCLLKRPALSFFVPRASFVGQVAIRMCCLSWTLHGSPGNSAGLVVGSVRSPKRAMSKARSTWGPRRNFYPARLPSTM